MNSAATPAFGNRARLEAWAILPLLAAAVAVCILRADGALHWDEPGYLYNGIYRSFAELIAGQVQITGIDEFTQGRILHVLQIKALMAIIGSSAGTFWALVTIHLVLLMGILMLSHRMLRELLPNTEQVTAAIFVTAMSPIVIYMAGKTLADTEALAGATLATWCLLRCSRGVSIARVCGAALAMAYITLTKNEMVFMPAGLCAAAAFVPIAGVHRERVIGAGILSALGAVAISVVALEALGIGVGRYLASYADALDRAPPLAAKLMNISAELGVLWLLAVVAAWLSPRRREAVFLVLWLAFAMAPFVLLVGQIEPRHLAVNLIAAAGLFALALEGLNQRTVMWRRLSAVGKAAIATLAVAVLMVSNKVVLAVMPHEVEIASLRGLLDKLDQRYGAGHYTVVTPWGYTDFHIIRVLWPNVDVRDLVRSNSIVMTFGSQSRKQLLSAYYDGRFAERTEDLAAIGKPIVYVGFRETFSVENLRSMSQRIAPEYVGNMLKKIRLVDHRESWLWRDSRAHFKPVALNGHYLAYELSLNWDNR